MYDPTPTAERREEILGELAEWIHAAAREAQRRLMEAETTDEFVKLAASLAKLGRGVRQSILMHDRLEGRRVAAEAAAEEDHAQAQAQARGKIVDRHRARISRAMEDRFEAEWPETEDLEANEVFNARVAHFTERLDDLSEREDFADTDVEALIAQLCEDFGIAPPATSPIAAPMAGRGPVPAEGMAVHAPNTS